MRLRDLALIWQYLGPRWLAYRGAYATAGRIGLTQARIPATRWDDQPLRDMLQPGVPAEPEEYMDYRRTAKPRFFFSPQDRTIFKDMFAAWDTEGSPGTLADDIAMGYFTYFNHKREYLGIPPSWRADPFSGRQYPSDKHWSRIDDFAQGDIKVVWEPNRFGFFYTLVRAYWRTNDPSYPELFWRLVEDWIDQNPPQRGVNWKCGQEISIRVMAWVFGLYGFLDAPATTPIRLTRLAQALAVSGQRIYANVNYALSQRNNHGIIEGLGLFTLGMLFPEFTYAGTWQSRGRAILESLGRSLIYDDGAFSQHSFNYQRLMLHGYLWCMRLAELNNQPFRTGLKEQVARSCKLLYQVQDVNTGRTPNYGHNDGALILPLNSCTYMDYRPVIQAMQYYITQHRCFPPGPWDEDLLWLFGPEALSSTIDQPERMDCEFVASGYYTVRSPDGFAFIRCAEFKDRPAQADLLHVDLWWKGINMALDPGTYGYNAEPPWDNSLGDTTYHNTVTVDGLDQMRRLGRFLWLPWIKGSVRRRDGSAPKQYWEGSHDGYERLPDPVTYRRSLIHLGDDYWLICDCLYSYSTHSYRLHWLLGDFPFLFDDQSGIAELSTQHGSYGIRMGALHQQPVFSIIRADPYSPRGWYSPLYLDRQPALSIDACITAKDVLFWTVLGPQPLNVEPGNSGLSITTPGFHSYIHFSHDGIDGRDRLIASVELLKTHPEAMGSPQ